MVVVLTFVRVWLVPVVPAQMFWARKPASKGPWVVSPTTTGPPPHLLISQRLIGRSRQPERGSHGKSEIARMGWREEELWLHIAETELRANSGERPNGIRKPRHIDDGRVPTGYEVPVRRKIERKYWLADKDVLRFMKRAHADICVVFIYNAPQGRQRVLRLNALGGPGRLRWSRPCRSRRHRFFLLLGVGAVGLRQLRRGQRRRGTYSSPDAFGADCADANVATAITVTKTKAVVHIFLDSD